MLQRRQSTASSPQEKPKWINFAAGATGGALAALATCPLEVVKTRLQTKRSRELLFKSCRSTQPSTRLVLSTIVRNEGIFGLWRGITPSLIGVVPARAIFFGCYSNLKKYVGASDEKNRTITNFICASSAGCLSATVTCPIWVIKTRLQLMPMHAATAEVATIVNAGNGLAAVATKPTMPATRFYSVKEVAQSIYRQEGIRAFYKGLSASYWGVSEGAMQLAFYEELKLFIEEPTQLQLFFMAATAKMAAAALTYPHEVVRTRLRDQRTPKVPGTEKYKGMIQSIRLIAKEEGVRGLYGGLTPHLMRVVPNAAIMYFVVEQISGTS